MGEVVDTFIIIVLVAFGFMGLLLLIDYGMEKSAKRQWERTNREMGNNVERDSKSNTYK